MGFNFFSAAIGAMVPVKSSSKQLLKQELKKYGINPYSLPSSLYDDLHEQAYMVCKMMASSRTELMNRMVQSMEHHAYVIAAVVLGRETESYDQDIVTRIKKHLG